MPHMTARGPTPPSLAVPTRCGRLLVLTVIAGFGVLAFPTLYIMPFKTQDDRVLGWALTARTLRPR